MKKNSRINRLIVLTLAFLLLSMTAGVGVMAENLETLRIAVNSPTDHIDPHIGSSVPHQRLLLAFYEPLLDFTPGTLELEPVLAKEWSSNEDRTEFTFELRQGVKFHDGTEFNAEAVVASFNRLKTIGQGESYLVREIESIDVLGPYTVRFNLVDTSPEFLFGMTRQFIVSPKAIEENEVDGDLARDWFTRNEAGTGPYTLARWVEGQEYVLDRFDDYWKGWDNENNIGRIIFQIVVEPATQRFLLERGEVDIAENIVLEHHRGLMDNPDIRVEVRDSPKPFYIAMNTERYPLDNVKIREAITWAFDYEAAIEEAMVGYAKIMQGPVPVEYPGHNPNLPEGRQDMDRAKELMAEAGYPDGGFTLSYLYLEHWLFELTVGLILQDNLRELGIGLEIEGQPWATMTARMRDPQARPDLVMYAQTSPTPSPLSIMYPMYHSESEHWSHFAYSNPRVDELLEKVGTIADDDERNEVYKKIQELVFYDYQAIYPFQESETMTFRENVKGAKTLYSWGGKMLNYYDLYKE